MSKVFLYAHGGSGNHGCEAIVRSTIKILGGDNVTLISSNPQEDEQYGVDKLCTIIRDVNDYNKLSLDFLKSYIALKIKHDFIPMEKLPYKQAFSNMENGDIALSIGGDNYCYEDAYKYMMFHDMVRARGAKSVLWSCSVDPDIAKQPKITDDLKRYDLITARETISFEALKAINPNTVLVSDSAFQLDMEKTVLPENFIEDNTIGINLSPMVVNNESVNGITEENYQVLIEYILNETNMNIALIPHVVWKEGDDRIPLAKLYEHYKATGRIGMVSDLNCQQLKYIISKCRFFIGARTHSTIAAYSMGVPTLVLGYSVKARGIARDLFGTENGYVVEAQKLQTRVQLLENFKFIISSEMKIRNRLKDIMPEYRARNINIMDLLK